MNKRMRTEYPPEFKLQAVERARVGDRSVRSLEQELGLSDNLLRQWVQVYEREGASAFVRQTPAQTPAGSGAERVAAGSGDGAGGVTQPALAQQRALEQRVAQLERENAILKKALALLSRDQWQSTP